MKLPTVPTVKIANLEEELDSENRLGATATSTVTTPNTQTPIWPRAETPQRTARLASPHFSTVFRTEICESREMNCFTSLSQISNFGSPRIC